MNANAWDRVIDDVARDMTAGAPAADFRARVMQQVAETRPLPSRIVPVWFWRGAVLAGAVAVVVFAVTVAGPNRSSSPAGTLAVVSTPSSSAPSIVATAADQRAVEPLRAPGVGREPQIPAALVEWQQRNIPALADLAALEMKAIQPAGLSMSQLGVTSLGIAPIVIAPIDDER